MLEVKSCLQRKESHDREAREEASGVEGAAYAPMKILCTSLLVGLVAEFISAVIGLYGAAYSDTLVRIIEVVHTPSMFLGSFVFSRSGRSTIDRDIVFLFVTQWLIYTVVIFAALRLRQRYKHRHDSAA